jgi:hypothetical protein
LDADCGSITDLLSTEMKTPVKFPQDRSLSFHNASTALDATMDVGIETTKIKQALQEALDAQTNPAARLLLIVRYERIDPDGAKKLMGAYRAL